MNSIKNIAAAMLLLTVLCGCSLVSPAVRRVNYYDLKFEGKEVFELPCRFSLRSFRNISPAKMNFLYTGKNSIIELDQYNCWVQSPEVMLRRYMLNAIKGSNDIEAKEFDVAVTVFDFKFDLVSSEAVLGINCIVRDVADGRKMEKNYIVEVPVGSADRVHFVKGMNNAVEKFIEQAVKDIQKF